MSQAEQNSDKPEPRQAETSAASNGGPDDARSSDGPAEARVIETPALGSDGESVTPRDIGDGEAREKHESSSEVPTRVASAVNRPLELGLPRAVAPHQRRFNKIIQQAVFPHMSALLDQNLLQPKMADLVASARMLGVANVPRAFTFPSPDISRILAELGSPAVYRPPLFDSSAAMRSLVAAQQAQFGSTAKSLSPMMEMQLDGPVRAALDASLFRFGTASAALQDVSVLVPELADFPKMSALAATGFNAHLDQLSVTPHLKDIRFTTMAGNTAASLLTAESLWTARLFDDVVEVAEDVYEAVVEPFVDPSSAFKIELLERVRHVSPRIAEKFEYAWRIVGENIEPVRSSVATQIVEVLDQLLRELAPADAVIAWLVESGRKEERWWCGKNGRSADQPTRGSKLAFSMRNRGRVDQDFVLFAEAALVALFNVTIKEGNAVKHGSGAGTQRTMESMLMACECILNLLLDELES